MNASAIPRPQSESDYAACYFANLAEARSQLERANARFRALRRAQQITPKVEGGWVFAGKEAATAYGDLCRALGDVDHWHLRLTQARANERAESVRAGFEVGADDGPQPDRRLPVERDDDGAPF